MIMIICIKMDLYINWIDKFFIVMCIFLKYYVSWCEYLKIMNLIKVKNYFFINLFGFFCYYKVIVFELS